jgi:hypothetical protein
MHPELSYTLGIGLTYHRYQVIDMRMHVTVGKKPDKMKGGVLRLALRSNLRPYGAFKDTPVMDGLIDPFSALREYTPRAERVMPDFAIPHIVV